MAVPYLNLADISAIREALGSGAGGGEGGGTDTRRAYGAVFDYINSNGGSAGRTLVPTYRQYNSAAMAQREPRDRDIEEACRYFTEDRQSFVWLTSGTMAYQANYACAQRSNMPILVTATGHEYLDAQWYAEMQDLWYATGGFLAEQRDRLGVEGLWAQGFFGENARVGLLIEDTPGSRRSADNAIRPALAAHGIDVVSQVNIPDPIEATYDSYILQFKTAGVTHILFGASWMRGLSAEFLMKAAQNQAYHPMWGVSSDELPSTLYTRGIPRAQMENVQAVGWSPAVDQQDVAPQSPTGELCEQIIRDAGQSVEAYTSACEIVFLLDAALDRAPEVSVAGLAAGMAALGDSWQSGWATIGGATSYGPGRPGGGAVYRAMAWDDGCACMQYASDTRPVP